MACDYYLAESIMADSDYILRLYTWKRPAISLGYHQKLSDVDIEKCRKEGVDIVRRPTGGRAILHHQESTYCFIAPITAESGKAHLKSIYRSVHNALSKALNDMGFPVKFAEDNRIRQKHNPLCFASSAGAELELGGKKIVGSAQRLLDKAVLQHGSILTGPGHLRLPQYLNLSDDEREKMCGDLQEKSTYIDIEDNPAFRCKIAESFGREFGGKVVDSRLSAKEISKIENNYNFQLI